MTPVELRVFNAKNKLIQAVDTIMREEDLPAYIFTGIMAQVESQLKDVEIRMLSSVYENQIKELKENKTEE